MLAGLENKGPINAIKSFEMHGGQFAEELGAVIIEQFNNRVEVGATHQHFPAGFSLEAHARGEKIVKHASEFYERYPPLGIPKKNANFVGRKDALQSLKNTFSSPDAIIAQAIFGLGGTGKSQLALQYVYELITEEEQQDETNPSRLVDPLERRYALKIWLRGECSALKQDLENLADWLGIVFGSKPSNEQLARKVYERLSYLSAAQGQHPARPRVLFIVDDIQLGDGLKELLPSSYIEYKNSFHWLLTSREQNIVSYFEVSHFKRCDLDIFSPAEALEFFEKAFDDTVRNNLVNYTEANKNSLAQQLGRLPLALAQAVSYINLEAPHGENINSYLQLLITQGFHLHYSHLVEDYSWSVIATWLISLPKILQHDPKAVELLLACAYLAGESISYELLQAYVGDTENIDLLKKDEVQVAVRYLLQYSLLDDVTIEPNKPTVKIHALVQEVLRNWISGELLKKGIPDNVKSVITGIDSKLKEKNISKANILTSLSRKLYQHSNERNLSMIERKRRTALLPHFASVIKSWEEPSSNKLIQKESAFLCYLLLQYACLLECRGDYGLAQTYYTKTLDKLYLYDEELIPNQLRAYAWNNLGKANLLNGNKNHTEIEIFFQKALSLVEEQPVLMASIWVNIGNVYFERRAYSEAKQHYLRALTVVEISEPLMNLAVIANMEENYGEAKSYLQKAKKLREDYPDDHIEMADILAKMAAVLFEEGQYEQAEKDYKKVLDLQRQYYGENHPIISTVLISLGSLYIVKGDLNTAISYFQDAIKVAPSQATAYQNLACCYHSQQQYDLANQTFLDGIKLQGDSAILIEYAHALMVQEKYQDALDYINRYLSLSPSDMQKLTFASSQKKYFLQPIRDIFSEDGPQKVNLSAKKLALYLQQLCVLKGNKEEPDVGHEVGKPATRMQDILYKSPLSESMPQVNQTNLANQTRLLECATMFYKIYHTQNSFPVSVGALICLFSNPIIEIYSSTYLDAEKNLINFILFDTISLLHYKSVLDDLSKFYKGIFDVIKTLKELTTLTGKVIFSGFSLAAGIAQWAACYYNNDYNTEAIAFDSPGMKSILDECGFLYNPANIATLLTVPNGLNTKGDHVGKLYRMYLNHVPSTSIQHKILALISPIAVGLTIAGGVVGGAGAGLYFLAGLATSAPTSGFGVVAVVYSVGFYLGVGLGAPAAAAGAAGVAGVAATAAAAACAEETVELTAEDLSKIVIEGLTAIPMTDEEKERLIIKGQHFLERIYMGLQNNKEALITTELTEGFVFPMSQWPTTLSESKSTLFKRYVKAPWFNAAETPSLGNINNQNSCIENKVIAMAGYKR